MPTILTYKILIANHFMHMSYILLNVCLPGSVKKSDGICDDMKEIYGGRAQGIPVQPENNLKYGTAFLTGK